MSSRLRDHDKGDLKAQWLAHCGNGAQARYRRQRERLDAKQRKQVAGVEVDANGRTPAGLIVPGMEPRP